MIINDLSSNGKFYHNCVPNENEEEEVVPFN